MTFEINADGLLEVRARDHDTGAAQSTTMRVIGGLTDEEVAEMAERLRRHDASGAGALPQPGDLATGVAP